MTIILSIIREDFVPRAGPGGLYNRPDSFPGRMA